MKLYMILPKDVKIEFIAKEKEVTLMEILNFYGAGHLCLAEGGDFHPRCSMLLTDIQNVRHCNPYFSIQVLVWILNSKLRKG